MFCYIETRDFLHTYHVGGHVDDHEVLILIFNILWDIFKVLHQLVVVEKMDFHALQKCEEEEDIGGKIRGNGTHLVHDFTIH